MCLGSVGLAGVPAGPAARPVDWDRRHPGDPDPRLAVADFGVAGAVDRRADPCDPVGLDRRFQRSCNLRNGLPIPIP